MQDESPVALARITPVAMTPGSAPGAIVPRQTSPSEKAAIIVRLLLAEGTPLPLTSLPEHHQTRLAEQMARMGLVDRATLAAVVDDFLAALDATGLTFPDGIDGALALVDGHISPNAASRLRRMAASTAKGDPWERIAALPPEELLPLLADEAAETAAVALSKLPVARAADLLAQMPGDRARRVALAMSRTAATGPETLRRIGTALVAQLDARPPRAFSTGPVDRIGAILNVSPTATREDVLAGLDEADAAFAEQVRRAIFTFAHIPARIAPRDMPRLLRAVDPAQIITALAAAQADPALAPVVTAILDALSPRMAQQLRDDMDIRGAVPAKEADAAYTAITAAIRQLEASGEITLKTDEG
ncbi:FliG C-terminal domain-containing protein [Paragemmobacter ruber]|nr:FliG C-terminal domain-containing protein [Rhodobacter ruber]